MFSISKQDHWDHWGRHWASICASCVCKAPSWQRMPCSGHVERENWTKWIQQQQQQLLLLLLLVQQVRKIISAIAMTMNQTATNADWPPSHLRFCNFTVCLQGLGDRADSFYRGESSDCNDMNCRPSLACPVAYKRKLLFSTVFTVVGWSTWGDANRPHPICSVSQPRNNIDFVTPWKIQTMEFDGLNNCKCDKRLKRRCYGATFIQDMEKEGHQTNQRHNCHSDAASRPRFKFSIRVVFSFSSWVIRFCSKAWTEA